MSVKEILETVQFVVDQEGKPQAAMLSMQAWETLLVLLEDLDDRSIVRERINGWRAKEGWSRWDDFDTELETDVVPTVDQ